MAAQLKKMIVVGGWKTILGAALIGLSAVIGFSGCVDIGCNEQAQMLEKTGEAFVGVGLGHKLQKLIGALKAIAQLGIDLSGKPAAPPLPPQ